MSDSAWWNSVHNKSWIFAFLPPNKSQRSYLRCERCNAERDFPEDIDPDYAAAYPDFIAGFVEEHEQCKASPPGPPAPPDTSRLPRDWA